jgi:hypothetical protein
MSYRSALSGLGQTPAPTSTPISPLVLIGGGLLLLTVLGAKGAESHQRSLYANRKRTRRNGRRKKR